MGTIKSYKDLIVWQKSIQLVKEIFLLTESYPKSELYGIISQMRRAAVSIPSNIAEAYGRRSTPGTSQFYSFAYGSALELETQIIISKELGLASEKAFMRSEDLLLEILKMLNKITGNFKNQTLVTNI